MPEFVYTLVASCLAMVVVKICRVLGSSKGRSDILARDTPFHIFVSNHCASTAHVQPEFSGFSALPGRCTFNLASCRRVSSLAGGAFMQL